VIQKKVKFKFKILFLLKTHVLVYGMQIKIWKHSHHVVHPSVKQMDIVVLMIRTAIQVLEKVVINIFLVHKLV